jgi:hypothetical protein
VTSGRRARAPRHQTLAFAPSRLAALQLGSFDRPWLTSRAEIVRLRGVPINRAAGDWVVERTHSWLNRFRSILIRWAKKPANYLALLHFALAIITWRHALPG